MRSISRGRGNIPQKVLEFVQIHVTSKDIRKYAYVKFGCCHQVLDQLAVSVVRLDGHCGVVPRVQEIVPICVLHLHDLFLELIWNENVSIINCVLLIASGN